MSDPYLPVDPQPPTARPAATLAALVLLVLVFVVGLLVGQSGALAPLPARPSPVSVGPSPEPGSALPEAPADFGVFWRALQVIRESYVGRGELTDEQITYGAIRGMVQALGDTGHSIFLTPEAVKAQGESLGGNVVGVGILLGTRDGQVIVVAVISGGPADRAGIRNGDKIVEVDGQTVDGLAPEEVAPKVRGEAGTIVVLNLVRPSTGERLEFSIEREQLRVPAASWAMIPGTDIGLLRLVQFSSGSAAELRAARDEAIAAGAGSLILDLRGNPGGYVHEAVDVASLFLNGRTVYIKEFANGDRTPVSTNDLVTPTDVPLVVLIDEATASSSEIVSGAFLSDERAELVGLTTFGTGTVLQLFGLPDGSAIQLAVERWLTPDGELIFGRGIQPTVEVALPVDETPLAPSEVAQIAPTDIGQMPDSQLRRAVELLTQ